jgi:Fe2+ or Zn2+ uptake regulation protein
MVCEQCGTMIEFLNPALDAVLRTVTGEHEFQASGRSLVIRGVCGDCNKARAAKRRMMM